MRYFVTILLLLFLIEKSGAQDTYLVGTLPFLNLNKGISGDWSINLKTESRLRYIQGEFSGNAVSDAHYLLTDFGLTTSRKTGLNNALAGGYLLRIREGQLFHRFIQQFTMVKRYDTFRMAHRLSSNQTLNSDEPWELRLRYRITAEIPLSGQSVDPGEFYLKLNNEYLNSWQKNDPRLEIRIVPLSGFVFRGNNKLEFGLDYRLSSFIDGGSRNSFWLNIGWYIRV